MFHSGRGLWLIGWYRSVPNLTPYLLLTKGTQTLEQDWSFSQSSVAVDGWTSNPTNSSVLDLSNPLVQAVSAFSLYFCHYSFPRDRVKQVSLFFPHYVTERKKKRKKSYYFGLLSLGFICDKGIKGKILIVLLLLNKTEHYNPCCQRCGHF